MALPFFSYRKERITLICMHRMSWKGSYAENKIIQSLKESAVAQFQNVIFI